MKLEPIDMSLFEKLDSDAVKKLREKNAKTRRKERLASIAEQFFTWSCITLMLMFIVSVFTVVVWECATAALLSWTVGHDLRHRRLNREIKAVGTASSLGAAIGGFAGGMVAAAADARREEQAEEAALGPVLGSVDDDDDDEDEEGGPN
jgi:hypothetical protein